MEAHKTTLTAAFLGMIALAGCRGGGGEELTARLNEANDKVVACRAEVNELKAQNADLKRKLAYAMANPALQLTDPEILNLIAELKSKRAALNENGDVVLGKGALDPKDASRVVRQGAQALQKCYERALKKNSALQMQSGLGVMLELTVKPTGLVQETTMTPQVDADLTDCVRNTAARWKFPPFAGDSVVVKQKLTLTPKT